ncbi:hypothetical protein DFH06DRAFT_1237264 [Mycena polygramma]|nr:hypothetical protein DFH06DRAFT_1237264 [Mycena polygramma]
MRSTGGLEMNRSLYETLTSRGSVYDGSTHTTVARLRDCTPRVSAAWQVLCTAAPEFIEKNQNFLNFPRVDERADSGWTHFVVQLRRKRDKWISLYDCMPYFGYFLDAEIGFGANIPNISLSWMAQSGLFVTGETRPSHFLVPVETTLHLTWEMVLSEDTDDSMETLPGHLHVFLQVPILDGGRVAEPQIYWSTHPTLHETSRLPPDTFQIRTKWRPRTDFATWEKHHYDVAKGVQEEYGFDPTTTAAAEVLGLPLLYTCNPKPAIFPDEDAWCTYRPRSWNRDAL